MKQNEVSRINEYIEICKRMSSSKFVKEVKEIKFSLKYDVNKSPNAKVTVCGFDEDLLRSVLMDFRKIYMKGERTYFFSIYNLIFCGTSDAELKNRITKIRHIYLERLKRANIGFYINEDKQTPEKIIDDWFNGHYFHGDHEKQNTLENLGFTNPLHKVVFVNVILDLMLCSIRLANNASQLLEE